MQVDGTLQLAPCCRQVALGGEEKVHCVAAFVGRALQVFPLTSNFDVDLIHPPACTNRTFSATKDHGHHWQNFQAPAMHGGMVHEDATFLHQLLHMAKPTGTCRGLSHKSLLTLQVMQPPYGAQ